MVYRRASVKDGFTIIEIVFVVAIIAILLGVAVPNYMSYLKKSRIDGANQTLRSLKVAVMTYSAQIGQLPSRLADLVKKPSDERARKKWHAPFLDKKEIPADPWGGRYQYQITPQGANEYELYSYGPSGKGAPKDEWISVWDED